MTHTFCYNLHINMKSIKVSTTLALYFTMSSEMEKARVPRYYQQWRSIHIDKSLLLKKNHYFLNLHTVNGYNGPKSYRYL